MKSVYTLKEDGFSAYWFEGSKHKEKAIIWMHGSAMNEKHCLADSLYLSEAGYSVLVLGFYYWKGKSAVTGYVLNQIIVYNIFTQSPFSV